MFACCKKEAQTNTCVLSVAGVGIIMKATLGGNYIGKVKGSDISDLGSKR